MKTRDVVLDSGMTIRPGRGRVLLRPTESEGSRNAHGERVVGGIVIPKSVKLVGEHEAVVVAVGPPELDKFDNPIPFDPRPGDRVWYETNASDAHVGHLPVTIGGVLHWLTRQRYIGAYKPQEHKEAS